MVVGDDQEPRHAEALAIVAGTEAAVAAILQRDGLIDAPAATLAPVLSAILLLSLSLTATATVGIDEILLDVRARLEAALPAV